MKRGLNFLVGYVSFDKVMFGTDWPLIKMKFYIEFMKNSGIRGRNLRKIMYKNAFKFFWKS
ncbi:MAG: hypothetical protein QMD12_01840 [Candidatus Aenigmarchaeota archaeon]|nr:hypothetical protein [Candidatus Aenigmarchaeota archaeon]